jgi:type II secretory pathway component PulL
VLGNLFDIGWKANRRNYALLTGSLADPQGTKRRSWLFFAVLCVVLAALLVLPMLLFGWLSVHMLHAIAGLSTR